MPTVTTRIAQTFKKPNIAESYGPFATLEAAMTYAENADIKCAGLTVGIDQPDGSIKEYWLKPVEGQLQFVEKGGGGATIDDSTTAADKTWSSSKIDGELTERDTNIGVLSNVLIGASAPAPYTNLTFESAGWSGHPARPNGAYSSSSYFRRYTFNLQGMYALGFRKVRFYGFGHIEGQDPDNRIIQGLVAKGEDENHVLDVESYIPYSTAWQEGWCELNITSESTLLVATILTNSGVTQYTQQGVYTDPSFVPSYVVLSGVAGGLQAEVESLDTRITAIEEEGAAAALPETYVPSTLYGIIGETMQEFVRGMVGSIDPYRYYSMFKCNQGKVYKRYFELTPAKENGAIPTLTMQHHVINDEYNESEVKTSDIVLCDPPTTSPQSNMNILCVGASTTAHGEWVGELKRRLTGSGGTPAGDNLSNITFVGRKTANGVKFEATGGWTWGRFFTPRTSYRFIVTSNPTVSVGTQYKYTNGNGQTVIIEVAEVNVGGDPLTDNILFSVVQGSGDPANASGTLTRYSSSGGDASIAYSSFTAENWAPFTDGNGDPSFRDYANTYCNNQIDAVLCFIGSVNADIGHATSLTSTIAGMKTFIDTLHSDFPNAKVLIGTVNQFSAYYGLEDDYGASTTKYTTWNMMVGARRYVQAVDDFIHDEVDGNGDNYSDYCFMVNTATEVDSEYVFPTTSKAVNTRMSGTTEEVGTNGAHPITDGLYMVADSFYRTFVNTVL